MPVRISTLIRNYDVPSSAFADPGLIPGMSSLTNGDIGRKQAMIKEVS